MDNLVLFTPTIFRVYGDKNDKVIEQVYSILYPQKYLKENGHRFIPMTFFTPNHLREKDVFDKIENVTASNINFFIYSLMINTRLATKHKAWLQICYLEAKAHDYSSDDLGGALKKLNQHKLMSLRMDEAGNLYFKWNYHTFLHCIIDEEGFFYSFNTKNGIVEIENVDKDFDQCCRAITEKLMRKCMEAVMEKSIAA